METNWLIVLLTACIPLCLGAVWYHPKVLGNAYPKDEYALQLKHSRSVYALALLFSLFLSMLMRNLVIHQTQIFSLLMTQPGFGDPKSEMGIFLAQFMEQYGTVFRSFKHGVVHGILMGLAFVLPVLGTHALFEGRGWKYIAVHVGYWVVSLAIMGGLLCAWG